MHTRTNWEELATTSHYLTATTVQTLLQQENWAEAKEGLNSLIAAMGRSERQAVRSQLVRLMSHIVKWKCQPEKRSSSWAVTIFSARNEIADSQEEVPSINRSYLESVWEKCLNRAIKQAELEMGKESNLTSLSWEEVVEDEYYLH